VNGGLGYLWTSNRPSAFHLVNGMGVRSSLDLNGNSRVGLADKANGTGDTDMSLMMESGLFFVGVWPPDVGMGANRFHGLGHVIDGLSQTIILSENVAAGGHINTPGWAAPGRIYNSFFLSGYICDNGSCTPGHVHYSRANDHSDPLYRTEAINASRNVPDGMGPWPSSFHVGEGVHVLFGDGHVQFISEEIDGTVYAALISPQGTRMEGPLRQPMLSDEQY